LEGSSPVIYFESLTPELVLAEDTWSINLEDPSYSNEECESSPSPHIVFKEKKILINRLRFDDEPYISPYSSSPLGSNDKGMIRLDVNNSSIEKDVEKAPNEGYNLPLNGAFDILGNIGDVSNNTESIKDNYKVDDNINVPNNEEAFINGFNQLSKSMSNISGANQLILEQIQKYVLEKYPDMQDKLDFIKEKLQVLQEKVLSKDLEPPNSANENSNETSNPLTKPLVRDDLLDVTTPIGVAKIGLKGKWLS
jgi:hypothetical protein